MELYKPVTEHLKLDMRMNLKTKKVEIKTTSETPNADMLQRAADFVHAFILGEGVLGVVGSGPGMAGFIAGVWSVTAGHARGEGRGGRHPKAWRRGAQDGNEARGSWRALCMDSWH